MNQFVLNIPKIDKRDLDIVGKYAVELGELSRIGIPISEGFVVTISCFRKFLDDNKLNLAIPTEKQIINVSMSKDIISQIYRAYKKLGGTFKESKVVLSLSSPFRFKNIRFEVKGDANLIHKIKEIWATQFGKISLLENEVVNFSDTHKLDISIIVQKRIENEKTGRIFTEDPLTSDKTKIVVEQDKNISHYLLLKHNFDIKFKGHLTKSKKSHKILDHEAHELAILGKKIERHFYFPQEIKFSICKNKVYILETKPMTNFISKPSSRPAPSPHLLTKAYVYYPKTGSHHAKRNIFLKGIRVFPGIATGPVRVYKNHNVAQNAIGSQIIVIPKIETSFFPVIKKARGLIVENESLTNHDRMIYRQFFGKPIIEGVKNATRILRSGNVVTVNGEKGEIYKGGFN